MNSIRFSSAYFFAACLLLACSQREEEPLPAGILVKDKMVVLLADIHLAEAAADNRNLNLNEINVVMAHRYEEIFQRHGITTEQFMSSYNYYLEHADQLTAIYEEVLNRLSTGESRANEGRRARVVNDSMRNVSMMVRDSVPAP